MQSQVRFNILGKVPEDLVQSQVRYSVPRKVPGGFGAEPGQVQQGFGEGFGAGSRRWCRARSGSGFWKRFRRFRFCFGAEPGQVPETVPEKVWALVQSQVRFNRVLVQSQVRFNSVPRKVPEKVWEALVQSQVGFNRVPEKVPDKVGEVLVQSQVGFNRVPEKVPEKVPGGFGAEAGQVQQSSGEGSEGSGFALVQGQGRVQRRCGRLECRARLDSTGFRRRFRGRFREALVQTHFKSTGFRKGSEGSGSALVESQVFPEKVPEKVWEALVQSQVRFNRVPVSGEVQQGSGEGSGEGVGGFGSEPGQVQQDLRPFNSQKPS